MPPPKIAGTTSVYNLVLQHRGRLIVPLACLLDFLLLEGTFVHQMQYRADVTEADVPLLLELCGWLAERQQRTGRWSWVVAFSPWDVLLPLAPGNAAVRGERSYGMCRTIFDWATYVTILLDAFLGKAVF